ncbi:Acetyltransferase (GNAT) family protein [Pseudarcicella hirudinis]|uniref:Acetyltransferase (GNAT) family protein n=1 Tax=Pseudarcicella hirudinis TaxID=1079859 RepID=A0A1I5NQF2_9BACT|nr:GNAT family N-acetyltransferase [Pseudarcicella hirudinis]SFP24033.1 Acetyltransferase (GNAT) family protein [Pseudarcicella hirudinis]
MENSFKIIPYQPDYKEDFKRINVEWIEKYFKIEEHDLEQLDAPDNITANGGQIFLALVNEEVVGTVALIHDGNQVFELAKMAVSPKAQGLGIGKTLCKTAIQEAKNRDAKRLYLLSNTQLTPALKIYENLGFTEVPIGEILYERTDIKMEYFL